MNENYDLSQMLTYFCFAPKETLFSEFKLSEDKLKEYLMLLNEFKEINGSNSGSVEKGKILEDIVTFIANQNGLFEIHKNRRNRTNEIDIILIGTPFAKTLFNNLVFPTHDIICECKNYNNKIDVTWVGKLYSLLKSVKCKIGIMFSYYGFIGTDWSASKGLAKKIFLSDDTILLDFNINDFEELENKDFLTIICDKVNSIKYDTEIVYNSHPQEEKISEILNGSKKNNHNHWGTY